MTKFKFWIMMLLIFSFVNLVACVKEKEEDEYEWKVLTNQEYYMIPEITNDDYYENVDKSLKTYWEVLPHFKIEDRKFTDDYGGVFIDSDGLLNILIIGNRRPVESDNLIYKQVENSLNFLLSVYDEANTLFSKYTIWKISISQSKNIVLISLEDEREISLLVEHLKEKQLFKKDAIAFYVGKNSIQLE